MPPTVITVSEGVPALATALRKAAAENGWDDATQVRVLLEYIDHVDLSADADLPSFPKFLKRVGCRDTTAMSMASPPYHGEIVAQDDDDELEEDDEDFDDELEDDDEDDFDDELEDDDFDEDEDDDDSDEE